MKTRNAFFAGLTTLISAACIASVASTAFALDTTPVPCDYLKEQLTHLQVGTSTYLRTKDVYLNQCSVIRPGCTSELGLTISEKHCKDLGQFSVRYRDPSDCIQVKCTEIRPTSSSSSSSIQSSSSSSSLTDNGPCPSGDTLTQTAFKCKADNQNYEYYTINGCRTVRCIRRDTTQGACPSGTDLTKKSLDCKSRGVEVEYFTDGVCRNVRCKDESVSSANCKTDTDIQNDAMRCKNLNLDSKITSDDHGCRTVQCGFTTSTSTASATSSCPTGNMLDMAIKVCKNSNMDYVSIPDNAGCRQVTCVSPDNGETVSSVVSSSSVSSQMTVTSVASSTMDESASSAKNPFSDIDDTSLGGQAAVDLYTRGIIGGFSDGTFKGNKTVNRAEAAKFLLFACGKNTNAAFSGKFKDVKNGEWFTSIVEAAAAQGIISGFQDGSFRPANTVLRAEFLKMFSKACGLPLDLPYVYKDVSSNDWFAAYAGVAQKYGMFPDSNTLLQPTKALSRFDIAIAINAYLKQK